MLFFFSYLDTGKAGVFVRGVVCIETYSLVDNGFFLLLLIDVMFVGK